jgi:hypothetical protein
LTGQTLVSGARRPTLSPLIVAFVCLLLAAPVEALSARFPLLFDSEVVRLSVQRDSLEVDATYSFVVIEHGLVRPISMLNPYPADSLLGKARTTSLSARDGGADWRLLPIVEDEHNQYAHWTVPPPLSDTLVIHTIYRQKLRTDYARYILTSTQNWERPLSRARFEITLPAGATDAVFSFPFVQEKRGEQEVWVYEATKFLPKKDIIVRWKHPAKKHK